LLLFNDFKMRASNALSVLFFAATTLAQAVEEGIAPSTPPPSDCQLNANGNFTIGTLKVAHQHKRESAMEVKTRPSCPDASHQKFSLTSTQQAADGALICNLHNGVLRDANGRTGSVVANRQFQFDGPPQAGAIYTGGFSICKNGSMAIGGTTQWWQCSSGPFYNLYDKYIGAQCEEIRIQVTFPQSSSSSLSAAASTTTSSVPVASVASSLITITGALSTVSASAVGPSASFSSNTMMASMTSSGSVSATGSVATGSATKGLTPGSSASAGATSAAAAPPAGGAAASFDVAKGSSFVALMAFVGAALII
jgi:hypothetical protein